MTNNKETCNKFDDATYLVGLCFDQPSTTHVIYVIADTKVAIDTIYDNRITAATCKSKQMSLTKHIIIGCEVLKRFNHNIHYLLWYTVITCHFTAAC